MIPMAHLSIPEKPNFQTFAIKGNKLINTKITPSFQEPETSLFPQKSNVLLPITGYILLYKGNNLFQDFFSFLANKVKAPLFICQ